MLQKLRLKNVNIQICQYIKEVRSALSRPEKGLHKQQ